MEELLEIKDILDRLNPKEKKAAKKYFSQHYSNTKELQLFSLIENIDGEKRMNVENRICKLGYDSSRCKSFQKLRSRLKSKLYDYLSTSISLNELRNVDSHSFLKHRLKKSLFQAGIFIDKGFFIQASDLLRTCLRLSQESEQFQEVVLSLQKLRQIQDIQGNIQSSEKLAEKVCHFQSIHEKISGLEFSLNRLISQIDIQGLENVMPKIKELKKEISIQPALLRYDRTKLVHDYLYILIYMSMRQHYRAWSLTVQRLKGFKVNSMCHDLPFKFLFYNMLIELLYTMNHPAWAQYFVHHENIRSKPDHLKFRLHFIENFSNLSLPNREGNILMRHQEGDGKEGLLHQYLQIHQSYFAGQHKKTLELIDRNIRKFQLGSLQQLDLMVLELICHFELQHFDLLEYRLQSFLKNLAYRSRYDVPMYYHIVHKVMHLIIRTKRKVDKMKINHLIHELQQIEICGLQRYRSFQPDLFCSWVQTKYELNSDRKTVQLDDVLTPDIHIHQVA